MRAFVINASTGQISVAAGAVLDHETKPSYTGQVSYTVQGQAATIDLTINVTDTPTPLASPARPRSNARNMRASMRPAWT